MGINTLLVRRPLSELQPGKAARNLIAAFEGLSLVAYPDPASGGDPWTIGYGHTGPEVVPGLTITLRQADELLEADMLEAWETVKANVNVALTQGEADALTSIAFNLGYVPKSMKAALNGGVTDKGERLEPGSYGSALKQFPRNCRAGGIPMRGLLRRRLAEACVFCGLPWEAACSLNIVRLKLDANNNPDPYETTSLEETLERARQDTSKPPDTSSILKAPWPAPKPAPTVTIITDKPASSVRADDKAGQPELTPPSPAPAAPAPQKPAASSGPLIDAAGPAAVEPKAAPSVTPPPPVKTVEAPKPKEPVVIAPRTIDPNAINYGQVDIEKGAKNMTDSRRFVGLLVVAGGSLTQVIATRYAVTNVMAGVFYDLSRDPIIVSLIAAGIIWFIGSIGKFGGRKTTTKGFVEAEQVLK